MDKLQTHNAIFVSAATVLTLQLAAKPDERKMFFEIIERVLPGVTPEGAAFDALVSSVRAVLNNYHLKASGPVQNSSETTLRINLFRYHQKQLGDRYDAWCRLHKVET